MKTKALLVASAAIVFLLSSCGSSATSGPAEKVLSSKTFTEVIKKYDKVADFQDGVSIVTKDYKEGAINSKGKEIVPPEFFQIFDASEGIIIAENYDYKYGAYTIEGELAVPFKYSKLKTFKEGLSCFKSHTENGYFYGYLTSKGEEVIPARYQEASSFSEGVACIGIRNGWHTDYGYIDNKGTEIITPGYNQARDFSEGIAMVKKSGKWFGIDKKENILFTLPKDIEPAGNFHEGMMLVGNDADNLGYINKEGELVIACEYIAADSFQGNQAVVVKMDGKNPTLYIIDKKGKIKSTLKSSAELKNYKPVEKSFEEVFESIDALKELGKIGDTLNSLFGEDNNN